VGDLAATNDATVSGSVTAWQVSPPLPAGLTLDPLTGSIGGLPTAEAAAADYTVIASNAGGQTQTTLNLLVGPPLPPGVLSLPLGFDIAVVAAGLATPSKLALAPDGRIFFNELKTGLVRVIDAGGVLQGTPFATLTVQGAGSHQGLMGLVLAPDFATSGHVFVLFCAPADATHAAAHMRLERYTDVAGVGTNATVVLAWATPRCRRTHRTPCNRRARSSASPPPAACRSTTPRPAAPCSAAACATPTGSRSIRSPAASSVWTTAPPPTTN
jgi:hypothetical protein